METPQKLEKTFGVFHIIMVSFFNFLCNKLVNFSSIE